MEAEGETEEPESERGERSRVGKEAMCGERSNEDRRTTSTVVARMRDHGSYAGWPNGFELVQGRG
jgi:hypothetical protein